MKSPFVATLAVVLTAFLAGCSGEKSKPSAPPAPVLTARVVQKNIPVRIEPPPVGHVTPMLSVTVRPQIGGVISEVHFQEGQEVRKDDLLFTIDPRPAQAALTLAKGNLQRDEAQLQNARIQFERDQKLFEQKLVSQDAFDTSKAAFDAFAGSVSADRAAVTNAELNLKYTEIRSPIDGRTGSLLFHAGNVVKAPDDVLLSINQIHPIYVAFAVAERFLPEIRKQMQSHTLKALASYDNLDGPPPEGELSFVDNSVDASTGTIQLKATFSNTDGRLWPGQFVEIALQLDVLTNAIVVPSQAVQTGQDGQYVFVVKNDKSVEMRTVKTGVNSENETVVTSGLNVGETVVTDGQLRLTPGVQVDDKSPVTNTP